MRNRAYIDVETRSEVDLMNSNASVYARHPSTKILCAVVKLNGVTKAFTNFEKQREAFLAFIGDHVTVAHNALFEQLLWQHYLVERLGYPSRPPSKWRCTMAKVLAHGLPRSLEKGGDALGLIHVKNMAGKKHMLQMCKPDGSNDPAEISKLVNYCAEDVYPTEEIDDLLPDLSDEEQLVWELDQEINLRGVNIDLSLVNHIKSILEIEEETLLEEFKIAVNSEVGAPSQRQVFKDWLEANGLPLPDLTAGTVAKIDLATLKPNVADAVKIRQVLSKTSNAKYDRITNEIDNDGRLRCNLIYHAASTGRWGGTGTQLQNLPRPRLDVTLALTYLPLANMMWPAIWESCADVAKSMIRGMIIPSKGKALIGADFAGIEARVTPWLAGQTETLEVFRRGEDIYCYQASLLFGYPINKEDHPDQRQVGKGEVLAFGYQGGIAALYKICALAGISIEPVVNLIWASATVEEKQDAEFAYNSYLRDARKKDLEHYDRRTGLVADIIKQRWRAANPKIAEFWTEVNAKAIEAVQSPGTIIKHGPNDSIHWYVEGQFLYCKLPSGRRLAYFKPRVEMVKNKFGTEKLTLTYLSVDAKTKQLVRRASYGGLLTENLVQAISRDIMVLAMFNVKNDGLDIVLTVHDEVVLECEPTIETDRVEELMTRPLVWAPDLPLAVSAWKGYRYGK